MNGHRFIEIGLVIILGWLVLFYTLPFERKYEEEMRKISREPLFRVILGALLISLSKFSLPVSILMFIIIFFLIADVHLVSTMKI